MNKIILIGNENEVLGEWEGVWGEEIWSEMNEECEVGVEFKEWSEGEPNWIGCKRYFV